MKYEIIPDPGRDGTRVRVHAPDETFDVGWSRTALKMLRVRGVTTSEDELTRGLLSRQPDILAQWQGEAADARAREPDRFPTMHVQSGSVRILNDVLTAHDLPLLDA